MLPNELPAFQSHIHALLADGDTRQVVADLLEWTKAHHPGWHHEALLISGDFEKVSRDELTGVTSAEHSRLSYNQLNDRLLQLTDRLADAPPSATTYFFKRHWKKLAAATVALGILASIAEITGYNVASFFEKKPTPIVQPDSLKTPAPIIIQQTTHSDQSPAVKTESGDVNIQYDGDDWEKAAEKKPKKDTLK